MNDLELRAQSVIERRLAEVSNSQSIPVNIIAALATRLTPWAVKKGWIKQNKIRISLTELAKEELDYLSCAVRWMRNTDRHHSQQVSKHAGKALRSILHGRLTCEQIFEAANQFQKKRKKAIDTNTRSKPFAEPRQIAIGKNGAFARWLICESDVSRIGHATGNCLANPKYISNYVDRARRGEIALVALHDETGEPVTVLSIAGNCLEELKGADNSRPWCYRPMLLSFLAQTGVQCGDCTDAAEIAICDELLHAQANGSCRTFKHKGTVCKVGHGFLAITHGQYTALLRISASGKYVNATVGTDDCDYVEARRYLQKRLRLLCRQDAEVLEACIDAFPNSDVVTRTWPRAVE